MAASADSTSGGGSIPVINDASSISLVADKGDRWLVLEYGAEGTSPRQRVEFMMLCMLLLCSAVTHHQVRPQVVEFVFAEPSDLHAYRMAFHCPLRFGQDANRMKLSATDATQLVEKIREGIDRSE